jgi:2-polyprenyl-3-methyl-5-hydroxy-6-metoxy-1,4-benzoquinol methylase
MKRTKSHFQKEEPILENLFQAIRFQKIEPFIKNGLKVLDLGCGFGGSFLKKECFKIAEGVEYDISVSKHKISDNINLFPNKLDGNLKLQPNYFDTVTALAVVEHLSKLRLVINQAYKTLKRGGYFILTIPSPKAKPILEFLAYKVHIVSEREIKDHKRYYSRNSLFEMLNKSGFQSKNIEVKPFGFGFNTLVVSKK